MGVGCDFFPGQGSLQWGLDLEVWVLTEELRISTGCGQMVWNKAWDPEEFVPLASLLGCLEALGEAWGVTV